MSEITLIRVGEGEAKPIKIIDEKTVIGRGPFLQVTDKRVSRSHAVLEVSNRKLYVTPTHTNPCFFKKNTNASPEIMKKDEKRLLGNGHVIGLLPDSLFFKVNCPTTQNGTRKSKDVSEDEKEDATESENESEEEVKEKRKASAIVRPKGGENMAMPVEKRRKLPQWLVQLAKTAPLEKPSTSYKRPVAKTPPKKKQANKDISPKRTPARRRKTESDDDEDFDFDEEETHSKRKKGGSPKKKYKEISEDEEEEDDWDEEEYKPKKRKGSRTPAKPRPRKKAVSSEEEDWDSEEEIKIKKKKRGTKSRRTRRRDSSEDEKPSTSRAARGARAKRKSYVDDFVEFSDDDDDIPKGSLSKEEDSDFVMEEVEDSVSDWEMSQKSSSKKQKSQEGTRKSVRRGGKRKSYADSDEDISEDDYVPRASKRRKAASSSKKKSKKKRRKHLSSGSEDSSEDDYVAPKRDPKTKKRKEISGEDSEEVTPKKRTPAKKKPKLDNDDEENEDEDEDEGSGDEGKKDKREDVKKVRQLKSKHRPPCMFGKKCYRKNPEHFTDFSHPGDISFDEQSDLEEEDDRPYCAYGPNCYRTNTQHLKQYRHVFKASDYKDPTDDKRSKGDEEDDTGPNTYDYNDSFIDDTKRSQQDASDEDQESGSEDDPSDEDLDALEKEAKQFVKNKKLTKAV